MTMRFVRVLAGLGAALVSLPVPVNRLLIKQILLRFGTQSTLTEKGQSGNPTLTLAFKPGAWTSPARRPSQAFVLEVNLTPFAPRHTPAG